MANEKDKILSPAEALEVAISKAKNTSLPAASRGPLKGSYDAWYKSQYDEIDLAAKQNGAPIAAAEINKQIKAKDSEWADGARDAWKKSQEEKQAALPISSENAPGFLMNLFSNPQGALMGLLMQLEPVKKIIATLMHMAGSLFSGKPLSFSEASAESEANTKLNDGTRALSEAGFGNAEDLTKFLTNTKASEKVVASNSTTKMPDNVPGLVVQPGTTFAAADHDMKARPIMPAGDPNLIAPGIGKSFNA